ncbi:MAG: response regulator [Bacteroidetes bacterium]|nr:response regulator [Bacteroidota bacterium]
MKILFIDDEPHLLNEYILALEEAGYSVEFQKDVEEAMRFFLRHHESFDGVILDVMMPAPAILGDRATEYGLRTGLTVLSRIREESPQMPVMLFTNLPRARISVDKDEFLEIRQKMETPPFAFPKFINELINKKKKIMKDKAEKNVPKAPHYEIHGNVTAQQVYVGDHGRMNLKLNDKKEVVDTFCNELIEEIQLKVTNFDQRQMALTLMQDLRTDMSSDEVVQEKITKSVTSLSKIVPWIGEKFEQLITGAAGSILGTAIIQGIKIGFGF